MFIMIKGVIFDFNGVLWWDGELQNKSWKEFSEKLRGTPLTDEEMSVHVHGRPNSYTVEYLLGKKYDGDLKELIQQKESAYREMCLAQGENFTLSPGAVELFNKLKSENVPFTIATASEKANVDFFVEKLNLGKWFDIHKIVYDDGNLPGKPAPDVYLKAAKNLELDPKDCMVIEDAKSGLRAAFAAGIGKIVALGPKEKHSELARLEGVNQVVESLQEIHI